MAFRYIGTSTTTITNEGTENPTINGMVVTTKTEGDIVFYQTGRYVWLDDMWNYQGDLHTHADVQSALNEIAEAYKGEEVRGSIYDAIALIDTRSAAMEDTIGANITSMVETIVDRNISTFILDYETSAGNVAQCNLTYEQLRTKLTSNLKAIVHVNGYECDCNIDVQSNYIDVYATSDPMKNNEDTRGTIYYKFNHSNDSVTVNYEQSAIKYQEKLTAGHNIIIDGNEISAVGGVNTIGIEFMIDTNTTYIHDIDEITINKTWSEVELYMDAVYDGDWDDYDLWHEIQKDCVLKDLRDYPDYSVYPLIGVKFKYLNTGYPVLLFSSRTLSDDDTPENNIHYISFKWPNHSWSDSHLESNIDEFDTAYTAGDGIDITNNEISISNPLYLILHEIDDSIETTFNYTSNAVNQFISDFGVDPIVVANLSTSKYNVAKLAVKVYKDQGMISWDTLESRCAIIDMSYSKPDEEMELSEYVEIYMLFNKTLYKIAYTILYSDTFRGTVSRIHGSIAKISTTVNGYGLSLSGNKLSVNTNVIQSKLIEGNGIELENVGTGANQKTQISVADALTMIGESSGSIASFNDGGDDMPLKSCIVNIEPVQSGSGDPSPSNVRPISGWTECNLGDFGKNLFNKDNVEPGTMAESSAIGSTYEQVKQNSTTRFRIKTLIPIFNKTITISLNSANYEFCYTLYDEDGLYLGRDEGFVTWSSSATLSPYYIAISVRRKDSGTITDSDYDNCKLQIEFGSVASAFVPYSNGRTYNIDFVDGSTPLTVYGGTLDVVSGVLTVDRAIVDLGTLDWGYSTTQGLFGVNLVDGIHSDNTHLNGICEIYKCLQGYNPSGGINDPTQDNAFAVGSTFVTINWNLLVRDSRYTDATAFKTAMNGVECVYKLTTPTTYQLTPTEVKTLLGINNIFADCGDVDVEYVRDATTVINDIGGGSYTNGNGIDITNDEISVKLRSSNPGLAFDPDGGLYATGGGGGGTTYTAGAGIDIDANNEISTFTIKIAHLNVSGTPTINHTWAEISSALETYGSTTCYLWYSHGDLMYDSAIGYYTIKNRGIQIKFTCIYDNTIEYRKYYLSSANVLTLEERTVTDYQKKLTAGTGISIDPTTNTISLDLPQAEGGGF